MRSLVSFRSACAHLPCSLTVHAGHRQAYNRGVLHRDISEGNILITGKKIDERGKRGVLIDFDNAIFWETHQPVMDDQLSVSITTKSSN